jgi:mannose-6-phosphate isomerase-like protein (cupin superfamily)
MTVQHPSTATIEPIVIGPGDGQRIQAGPLEMLVIEDGSHTSGSHAVIEFTLNGQFSPPPHVHRQHEEVIYILEGEMAWVVGDETFRLGPGAAFVTPIGLPHTFRNAGTDRLRFLLTISPASHLGYFEAMGEVMQEARGIPDPQTWMAVMQQYGLEPVESA